MKTEVTMVREMGGFEIFQKSKSGMFNATALLKQWNEKNNQSKEVTKFLNLEKTKIFIDTLLEEENLDTHKTAYVKSKASRGVNSGTWMHPYLFVKFAMWINPKFEYHVIKFVSDQLLDFRNKAGDNYKELTSSLQWLPDANYPKAAKVLNAVIFGGHEKERRNKATEKQLNDLNFLQRKIAEMINDGYIKNFQEFLQVMRLEWKKRHVKKVF